MLKSHLAAAECYAEMIHYIFKQTVAIRKVKTVHANTHPRGVIERLRANGEGV